MYKKNTRIFERKITKVVLVEEKERFTVYLDGLKAMFRKKGSDHARLTRMIEALPGLVSDISMLVKSMGRSVEVHRDGMWAMCREGRVLIMLD